MNANEKFRLISAGRSYGRTEAMLKGAIATGATIVCADQNQAASFARWKVKTVTLGNLDKLRGRHDPTVFDHFALEELWREREMEFEEILKKLKVKTEIESV